MHPAGVENIITAILKDAINEYDNAVGYVEKHSEDKTKYQRQTLREKENQIFDCEKFFRSSWFEWLCDINPEDLISAMRMRDRCEAIKWNHELDEEVEE